MHLIKPNCLLINHFFFIFNHLLFLPDDFIQLLDYPIAALDFLHCLLPLELKLILKYCNIILYCFKLKLVDILLILELSLPLLFLDTEIRRAKLNLILQLFDPILFVAKILFQLGYIPLEFR